jgi:hypothetical protein
MNRTTDRATRRLTEIRNRIGGEIKLSMRGAPMLILRPHTEDRAISVCYFGQTKKFRVFRNVGLSREFQKTLDFDTPEQVANWYRNVILR